MPKEQSLSLMIEDVLGELPPEVEAIEGRGAKEGGVELYSRQG